jgi:hypothetical protein
VATSAEIVIGLAGGVLAAAAGVSLASGTGPGLHLLVPGLAIALGTSVRNAWRLMVDVAQEASVSPDATREGRHPARHEVPDEGPVPLS